jgi:hypothetical protein
LPVRDVGTVVGWLLRRTPESRCRGPAGVRQTARRRGSGRFPALRIRVVPARAGAHRNNYMTRSMPRRSSNRKLLAIPGWQAMPRTEAAQAVRRSAYPDGYANREQPATALVAALAGSGIGKQFRKIFSSPRPNCPGIVSSSGQGSPDPGCAHGAAVLARAARWLTAWDGGPVSYQSNPDPSTWFDGYRRDCLGRGPCGSRSTPPHARAGARRSRRGGRPTGPSYPGQLGKRDEPEQPGITLRPRAKRAGAGCSRVVLVITKSRRRRYGRG